MRWTMFEAGPARLIRGDCSEVLPEADVCADSLVCDPPAGISFMGKDWDSDRGGRQAWVRWLAEMMRPAFDALKPGAHGLVWALPRTSHWTACALEDAGFEVRDRVSHLFGTGFPKSTSPGPGLGSALKPSVEDWWLVRKPLERGLTLKQNLRKHGTGALNIDVCRIGAADALTVGRRNSGSKGGAGVYGVSDRYDTVPNVSGRWPAHLVLDPEAAAMLDAQSGVLKSGARKAANRLSSSSFGLRGGPCAASEGGASRFFFVAKPSTAERDRGTDRLRTRLLTPGELTGRREGSAGLKSPRAGAGRSSSRRNVHPTVKSVALMRWLIRLVTPFGGLVLDPFAGSGSTGVAALEEGRRFIGIERDEKYARIACARLAEAAGLRRLDRPAARTGRDLTRLAAR